MRLSPFSVVALLGSCLSFARAESSWSYEDANVSIQGKGTGVAGGFSKEKFSPTSPLSSPVSFGPAETLKVTLTTTEDSQAKRPHQVFLTLADPQTGLEESYPFNVKDTGRAKVEVTHKDLPIQLLTASQALKASLTIGSFGSSTPLNTVVFDVNVQRDQTTAVQMAERPVRYGKLPEIRHIFRSDPQSPPKLVTVVFTAAALVTLPALVIGWVALGANLNHLSQALGKAPVSHGLFYGSIIALEGIFFLYYRNWTLFQTLPAAAAVGSVAFLSGSRALSEVQARRLAGKR